jgi:Zn finger protein HypA/HybF involved in hydrogenase expression
MREEQYIAAIVEEAQKKGNVYEIALEVGELSSVDAKVIQRELLKQKNWTVLLFEAPGKVGCLCGYVGRPKIFRRSSFGVEFTCPKCNALPAILEGNNVKMKEVKTR